MNACITVRKVRVNNLDIPELSLETGKLHVFCGPSGSGKSSLSFDVLYAAADAKGEAHGISRVYRRPEAAYSVEGLPRCVIGIEQQLTPGTFVESVAWHVGVVDALASTPGSGYCPTCAGKGYVRDIDPERVIRDADKRVTAGALSPAVKACAGLDLPRWKRWCEARRVDERLAWSHLPEALRHELLFGSPAYFKPVIPALREALQSVATGDLAEELPYYTACPRCPACHGWGTLGGPRKRVKSLTLGELATGDKKLRDWVLLLELEGVPVLEPMFRQSSATARKLRFLKALQRLAPHSLIIFDEPAAGMTHLEAVRMAQVLRNIQAQGHTVIAVDHMEEIILAADVATVLGPGSGEKGGRVVKQCSPDKLRLSAGRTPRSVRVKGEAGEPGKRLLAAFSSWYGFAGFAVDIPLLRFVCVCGPSGSGKTSFLDACHAATDKSPVAWQGRVLLNDRKGNDAVRRPHKVTPDAIGLHSGSTPATYTGLWDKVRTEFAALPEARRHRLDKGHFSFNSRDGQCPRCLGRGYLTDDGVHFEECPVCHGARFKAAVLTPRYKSKSIAQVNAMTMLQASELFRETAGLKEHLRHFHGVGLEYLVLGQPSNTLSGGENLRVKIVDLLSRKLGERSLYIMDNPCRGIGPEATVLLVETFKRLAQKHTILVAENAPAVAAKADWIVLLGRPHARPGGGRSLNVRYAGPPAQCPDKVWNDFAPAAR